jgi:hypothetical protein
VWRESLAAPAQFDLSLSELRFSGRPTRTHSSALRLARSIRLAVTGPTGLYYVAGAVTRFSDGKRPRVLMLVVNRRPRGSLAPDLARIGVAVTAARRLGAPVLAQVSNAFTRARSRGPSPALCDVPVAGSLTAGALRPLLGRGPALEGFDAPGAIAQAYDAVCGKVYDAAFRAAVTRGSTPTCAPAGAEVVPCCPPNAPCAPPPCPPCEARPCPPCGCPPCPLAAGQEARLAIACPLQTEPVICPL